MSDPNPTVPDVRLGKHAAVTARRVLAGWRRVSPYRDLMSTVWAVFKACQEAVSAGIRTNRPPSDKEFHFQNWVYDRIVKAGHSSAAVGRNTYPDFSIDGHGEAYEVKGITVGSRERDFDSNSALPSGTHNGNRVFYVFGRYEDEKTGGTAPRVLDIALVDGTFLNAGPGFVADNKSLRVLGSYGDILLRDRKMYAPYTPYKLLTGLRGHCTLVLPASESRPGSDFLEVGRFSRVEGERTLVAYRGDLEANTLTGEYESNPTGGQEHPFVAYRLEGSGPADTVELATA